VSCAIVPLSWKLPAADESRGEVALPVQMVPVARHAILIVDAPPAARCAAMSPVRRSGLSRPTSVIVLPRNVICDGGAGWIERRFGGAATLARTCL